MQATKVALLAEGVDRNTSAGGTYTASTEVALLAEGVDRNTKTIAEGIGRVKSPSSRRAWIEIRNHAS